jgi:hypothetical protein
MNVNNSNFFYFFPSLTCFIACTWIYDLYQETCQVFEEKHFLNDWPKKMFDSNPKIFFEQHCDFVVTLNVRKYCDGNFGIWGNTWVVN